MGTIKGTHATQCWVWLFQHEAMTNAMGRAQGHTGQLHSHTPHPAGTSSAPVTEYACPFTSFWYVMASESAALVICKSGHSERHPASLP